ncbi:MAG: hypothetical protein WAO98_06930 [Alphaproteobacteria bacterium]
MKWFKLKKKTFWDLAIALTLAGAFVFFLSGAERLTSDIATRIRYALRDGAGTLALVSDKARAFSVRPNVWPDNCKNAKGYRIVISPYKGNKQVESADINVYCHGGRQFYTGTELIVRKKMSVEKSGEEAVIFILGKTEKGTEILSLE